MKIVRTVRQTIETEADWFRKKPQFNLGDWVEHRTGPRFRITDLRYNGDLVRFEYLDDKDRWHGESCLTLIQR